MKTRLFILALAMVVASCGMLEAGAWAREDGTTFLSAQVRQDMERPKTDPTVSIYGEYGLTTAWTLGGKLEYSYEIKEFRHIAVFGRWHVQDDHSNWSKALGFTIKGTVDDPYASPAIHLGRGFETRFGPGWLDVEVDATFSLNTGAAELGAFALAGLKPHPRVKTMMALDLLLAQDGNRLDAIPSVAWQFDEGKHIHLEWARGIAGGTKDEVALGLWLEF